MGRRWAYLATAWAHGTVLTAHTGPGAHPTRVRGRRYAWHASTHAVCRDDQLTTTYRRPRRALERGVASWEEGEHIGRRRGRTGPCAPPTPAPGLTLRRCASGGTRGTPPRARCALATCLTDSDLDDQGEPSGGVWCHGEKMSISGEGVGARDRAHRPHRPRGPPYEGAQAEVRVARLHARGMPWQQA